jgi:hypothetical protein
MDVLKLSRMVITDRWRPPPVAHHDRGHFILKHQSHLEDL